MRFKYTPEEVMKKYPRIVAHLIAESLGYFTPRTAAIAIIKAKNNEPYFCEWYADCAKNMEICGIKECGEGDQRSFRTSHKVQACT